MSALQCALRPWRAARRIREQREDLNIFIRITADMLRRIPEDQLPWNERPRHLHAVK